MRRIAVPRWVGIASRTVAALGGGYGLASLVAAVCAVGLPLPRPDAVLAGMMIGLGVQAAAAIWVFAARTAIRAWIGLAIPGALLGALLLSQVAPK